MVIVGFLIRPTLAYQARKLQSFHALYIRTTWSKMIAVTPLSLFNVRTDAEHVSEVVPIRIAYLRHVIAPHKKTRIIANHFFSLLFPLEYSVICKCGGSSTPRGSSLFQVGSLRSSLPRMR